MAINSRVALSQGQRLALSPQMRQSLSILRMPTQALNEAIAAEAAENPFLIVEPSRSGMSTYDYAVATVAAPESLTDRLRRQIVLQRVDGPVEAAALYLVSQLRDDGYLDVSLPELAGISGVSANVLEAGLAAVHRCDPPGIGARTLAECLELQLVGSGLERTLARAVAVRLDDFAQERWAKLSRGLGLDERELKRIAALLHGMSSAPLQDDETWVEVTVPDIVIEIVPESRLSVSLATGTLPRLAIMDVARGALKTEEMRTLHSRAAAMSTGIAARNQTLLRIGNYIAETQSAFFLNDYRTIAPVTRGEAATALAMHPSTLSRALAGKALLAGNTVYPLAQFFSHAMPGADGDMSPFDIQRRIRDLIAEESAEAPLGDAEICARLRKEGVDIARRTVAKYRKCMRVPSSFGRKRRKVPRKSRPGAIPKES